MADSDEIQNFQKSNKFVQFECIKFLVESG